MTVYTDLLAPTKSEKHGAFNWTPASDAESADSHFAGTLAIMGKRNFCRYRVEEFPADHGRGFLLAKIDPGSDRTEGHYSCLIPAHGPGMCECRGWYATGACKHAAALTALVRAGQL